MSAEYIAENEANLLDELLSVRDHFCLKNDSCRNAGTQDSLAVLRLCPGMTLEAWEILAERHGLNDWLTVDLDKDMAPHLNHIQSVLQELSYKTEHDPLTGLSNRRVFERMLDQEIERSRRNKTPLSLAILDLDNFKAINDTYGHLKGDEVLIDFGELLSRGSRRYDLVARIGGEEFVIVMNDTTLIEANNLAEKIRCDVQQHEISIDQQSPVNCTISIGVSCNNDEDSLLTHLLSKADKALYNAKNRGRNRVHLFSAT